MRRVHQLASSRCDRPTYTLTVLAVEGFLPGYGVYEGGITASARRGFARQSGPGPSTCPAATWSPCGSSSPATGSTPTGARSTSPATTSGPTRRPASARCGSTPRRATSPSRPGTPPTARPGGVPIDALPLTDLDLAHESRITEDENLRFSMPVSVLGRLRKRNRGGKALQDRRPGGQPPPGPGDRTGQPRRGGAGQGRANSATGSARSAVPPRRPTPCRRRSPSSSRSTRSGAARR